MRPQARGLRQFEVAHNAQVRDCRRRRVEQGKIAAVYDFGFSNSEVIAPMASTSRAYSSWLQQKYTVSGETGGG